MYRRWIAILLLSVTLISQAEERGLDLAINPEVAAIYPLQQQRVRQALAELGYRPNWVDAPFARRIQLLQSGVVDGLFLILPAYLAGRDFAVRVEEPLVSEEHYAYAIDEATCERYRQQQRLQLGGIKGVIYFEQIAARHQLTLFYAPSIRTLIQMLQAGRLDITFANPVQAAGLVPALGVELVRCSDQSLLTAQYFLFLHQRHQALAVPLAEALRRHQ
ncbi:hypothetical protein BGP77_08020 [Saccharospirillum sp. MSK14-1]|uniref:hypothetical protein n=1 Tax=Saccharospirillum sp. MSK14-1 TaxID=1897632 RepID=UPI000D38AD02|nr:hypothetical protein [Saccharospirillum sp. MSK14-1]PTY37202.1 hypothetical protein BGP77_08020 [Saccharospirillum sp. MSK14-1]